MTKELWVIWKDPTHRRRYNIGSLIEYPTQYTFKYNIDVVKELKPLGFDYLPGFEQITQVYQSKDLFPNILNRLPNPNRMDYEEVLASYELTKNNSSFEILERTKGRLLTDNYEFVPAFNKSQIEFELAGTRYCRDFMNCKNKLNVGDRLELELEQNNKYDENAIIVIWKDTKKHKIGYVPRYYSKDLTLLLKNHVHYTAKVNRVKIETLIKDEFVSAIVTFSIEEK